MSFQSPEEIPGITTFNFLKVIKSKKESKPVKVFEFKDNVKKYMNELNMNEKLINRNLNVDFSGGEKKKNEILQMLVLNPKLAILDETDSGLDVDAIKTVSEERSRLGAVQNRLEHTISNLDNASENLTAAESRIRDVDMAKEMSNFSKNNILQQAAQAMLAQANQQPQNVLQLLR